MDTEHVGALRCLRDGPRAPELLLGARRPGPERTVHCVPFTSRESSGPPAPPGSLPQQ